MIEREQVQTLEPVQAEPAAPPPQRWASWLIIFLRVMAAISLIKGRYHWAVVCGIDAPSRAGFEAYSTPYQAATVVFAVMSPFTPSRKRQASESRSRADAGSS